MIESRINKELERQIDLYVNGKLTPEETDNLWAELIQDEYYLDYMKSVANLKGVIEKKRNVSSKPRVIGLRSSYTKFAAAAAVIIAAGLFGFFNLYTNSSNQIEPISEIPLENYREADGAIQGNESDKTIREAVALANAGEIEKAVSLLQNELKDATKSDYKAKVALSLGSIHYNAGAYQRSIENFKVAISQPEIDVLVLEEAYWFLGNAYFQTDQISEAQSAFEKAYELNGAYRRVVKSYLDVIAEAAK